MAALLEKFVCVTACHVTQTVTVYSLCFKIGRKHPFSFSKFCNLFQTQETNH